MDTEEIEVLPAVQSQQASLVTSLTRAEIDMQISTARAYPRHLATVQKKIMDLACLDDEAAEESLYAVKRGGKVLKGPSIRFAEILKQAYGNCRAGARVVHVDREEGFVEAEGIFHDLETNSSSTKRVRRRILDKNGKVFTEDMIIVTGNAACSIALRNATLDGVPKPLWRRAFEHVERVVAGDVKTLSERRDAAIKVFAVWGITPEQILEYLDVKAVEDITTDHLIILTGVHSAIKNGEETVESAFFGTARNAAKNDRANPFGANKETPASPPSQAGAREPANVSSSPKAGSRTNSSSQDDRGAPGGAVDRPSGAAVTFDDLQTLSDKMWAAGRSEDAIDDLSSGLPSPDDADAFEAGGSDTFQNIVKIHRDRVKGADAESADRRAVERLADIGIESPEGIDA